MAASKFRSRISAAERHYSASGSPLATEYGIKMDENGHKVVYSKGQKNIYKIIQEALPGTLIENILKRAELGDPTALQRKNGQYIDATTLPKNLMEVQNTVQALKEQFMELPVQTRQKFDNSPDQYVLQYGQKIWEDKMGITERKEAFKKAASLPKEEKQEVKADAE